MIPRSRIPDLLAFAACALLAFLALYNPIFQLPDHVTTDIVPVVTDYFHYHWNYWWIRHALTAGLNVYETNYVFAPFTSSLALHPLTPFWYPLWALFEPISNTAVAMTVVLFAAYTLTGYGFYLLLRDEGIAPKWALIGAAMLELCALMTTSARWTLIDLMAWFWLPITMLTWKRITRASGWRAWLWGGALGAVIWGMILSDIQYPLFVAPLIVPYGLWTLWRAPNILTRIRLIAIGLVAIFVGVILSSALGPLDEAITFDRTGLSPTPADRAVVINFPACHVTHCEHGVSVGMILLPLVILTGVIWWFSRRGGSRPAPAYLGMAHHAQMRHAPTNRAPRWLWVIMIPVPLILSVGASIQVGDVSIPMPYALLHQLFGGMVRYPERLPVFLIPALMFAFGILNATPRVRRAAWWLAPLLFLLVIADSRALSPIPVQALPKPYAVYDMIGAEPYDEVVVEIPTGGASGEGIVGDARYAELEWYGMTHGKRMVNGHISRVNTYNYFYMNTDDPMMAWLGQRRFLEPEIVAQEMTERIPEWRIGYFMVHRDLIAPNQVAINEIVRFFNAHDDLVCPLLTEGDLVVYRTRWHPDGCPALLPDEIAPDTYQIDIGAVGDAQDDALFIGEGWYYPETLFDTTVRWGGEDETASVYTDLPPGAYTLTLTAQAFSEARTVTVSVNGVAVGNPLVISPDGLSDYIVSIPAELIGDGQHVRVTLAFDARRTPREVGLGEDDRTLAVMVDRFTFESSSR